jgi:Flp pilus assembly protein TadG
MFRTKLSSDMRGSALLEAALLMPVLLLLTLGIVYLGIELWSAVSLSQATYIAARCRAVDSTKCADDTAATSLARSGSFGLNANDLSFQTVACQNGVSHSGGPALPSTVTLSGTDQTRIRILYFLNLSIPLQAKVCYYKQS